MEVRVLELCGKASSESTVAPSASHMDNDEDYLDDGLTLDSIEPMDVKELSTVTTKQEKSCTWKSMNTTGDIHNDK